MMRFLPALVVSLLVTSLQADDRRLNQIQVIGSHNSYHIAPSGGVKTFIQSLGKGLADGLDYTHPPLADQFGKLGIRQIELDVFADSKGGLYAKPMGSTLPNPGPDPNSDGVLNKPGFKVLHVPDIDYMSTVPTFTEGLKQVRAWSRANPKHVPILVLVELKDKPIALLPTKPEKLTPELLDALDAEIRAVFGPGEWLSPDDVRGNSPTLLKAIQEKGWPTLDAARGKVMFAMDNEGALSEMYRKGHANLKGRAMFAVAGEQDPAAAFFKINEPIADFDKIQRLVKAGFLVRTRADADTKEGRANDTRRRDKALASGAQFVSTDFREARKEWSAYQCTLPGGVVARANPVDGAKGVGDLEGMLK